MAQAQAQSSPTFEDQARKLVAARYSVVFVVTHEEEIADRTRRIIRIRDGQISEDVRNENLSVP